MSCPACGAHGYRSSGKECFTTHDACLSRVTQANRDNAANGNGNIISISECTQEGAAANSGTPSSLFVAHDPGQTAANVAHNVMSTLPVNASNQQVMNTMGAAVGAGVLAAGVQSLLEGPTPEQQAAAAAQQAQEEAAARERAAAEIRRTDAIRDRLLGQMQGVVTTQDTSSSLPLMGTGTGTNFFGKGNGGIQLLHSGDAAGGAPSGAAAAAEPNAIALDPLSASGGAAGITAGRPDAVIRVARQPTAGDGTVQPPPLSGGAPASVELASAASAGDAPTVSVGQTVALIPRSGDPEHLAAGQRYVDCKATRTLYQRMAAGMPAQRDWLQRTQAQIDGSLRERRRLDEESRDLLIENSIDALRDLIWQTDILHMRIQSMKGAGMSAEQSREWLKSMKELNEWYEKIHNGSKLYDAAGKYHEEWSSLGDEVHEHVAAIHELLEKSGAYDSLGKKIATGLGPEAVIAFSTARLVFDAGALEAGSTLNDEDLARARAQYEFLRQQYSLMAERVGDAKQDLAQYCAR